MNKQTRYFALTLLLVKNKNKKKVLKTEAVDAYRKLSCAWMILTLAASLLSMSLIILFKSSTVDS